MGGHSYPSVLVHAIFSTKQRRNSIPAEKLEDLWRYFGGIARGNQESAATCAARMIGVPGKRRSCGCWGD